MKKLTGFILSLITIAFFASFLNIPASADELSAQSDQCNQEFTYTVEEDGAAHLSLVQSSNRVQIDFYDADDGVPSVTDDQLTVTAGSGYEITSIKYETEDDAWTTVSTINNPTTEIHLSAATRSTQLDATEVKVKKVCVTPTPIITATPTCTPTPSVTTEPTVTPTPTNTPSTGSQGGDGLSDGRSDGRSSGIVQAAVLGTTTMASTGTFAANLMNIFGIFGMLLLAAGYKSYAKDKKNS